MRVLAIAAVVAAGLAPLAALAAADCTPSKWGPNDEIGSANYVTPKQVLMAVKLVKKGQSHPLGIVIDSSTPAFPPHGRTDAPGGHTHGALAQRKLRSFRASAQNHHRLRHHTYPGRTHGHHRSYPGALVAAPVEFSWESDRFYLDSFACDDRRKKC